MRPTTTADAELERLLKYDFMSRWTKMSAAVDTLSRDRFDGEIGGRHGRTENGLERRENSGLSDYIAAARFIPPLSNPEVNK